MMLSNIVRKKLQISTASEEFTTASVVARPTPTAPSRRLGHFHCPDFRRHGCADAARYHQCREHRAKFATDRHRYHSTGGGSHSDLVKLKECLSCENSAGKPTRDHDNKL